MCRLSRLGRIARAIRSISDYPARHGTDRVQAAGTATCRALRPDIFLSENRRINGRRRSADRRRVGRNSDRRPVSARTHVGIKSESTAAAESRRGIPIGAVFGSPSIAFSIGFGPIARKDAWARNLTEKCFSRVHGHYRTTSRQHMHQLAGEEQGSRSCGHLLLSPGTPGQVPA